MTEDQAKTKWCPLVRQSSTFAGEDGRPGFGFSYNRAATLGVGNCNCIGSDCMAWRWIIQPVAGRPAEERIYTMPGSGRQEIVKAPAVKAVAGDGYCGLAGTPPIQVK